MDENIDGCQRPGSLSPIVVGKVIRLSANPDHLLVICFLVSEKHLSPYRIRDFYDTVQNPAYYKGVSAPLTLTVETALYCMLRILWQSTQTPTALSVGNQKARRTALHLLHDPKSIKLQIAPQ